MAERAIHRLAFPANDAWHEAQLTGPIVHVATRHEDIVEVWYLHDPDVPAETRAFRVVGTGHRLPSALDRHIGTAITPSGRFVWHLTERKAATDA